MADESNIAGKRKKKRPKCPNQHFITWLDEWIKEAAERGLKSQHTYRKAQRALQKFPVRLESGKACKVLEGFGDKICSLLDERLAEHIAAGGSLSTESDSDSEEAPAPRKKKCAAKKQQQVQGGHGGQGGQGERRYIPQYRSGAYALLITLHRNAQRGTREMKKQDLMREAQPLADKDFLRPEPGCRYTSWSSMGTLIRKGYVIKKSSPAKYELTESGRALAEEIEAAGDGGGESLAFRLAPPAQHTEPQVTKQSDASSWHSKVHAVSSSSEDEAEIGHVPLPDIPTDRFTFSYVSESGREVRLKDEAAVKIDDSSFVGFLVCTKYEALLLSGARYEIDVSRSGANDEVYAYLHNDDAPEESTKSLPTLTKKAAATSKARMKSIPATTSTIVKPADSVRHEQTKEQPKQPKEWPKEQSTNHPKEWTMEPKNQPKELSNEWPKQSKEWPKEPLNEWPKEQLKEFPPLVPRPPPPDGPSSESQEGEEPICTLRPGTFDIVLCVDNREVYGAGSSGKEALLKELQRNNLMLDVRVLQVGDFLWVARARGGGREEVVLNYVVERKRMDDLASSIMDGRFKEQKFRMKNCQLQKPIYLVEDYGSIQHFSIAEDTLRQAIINTQITEEFYVKRTRDIKESAAYLTIMTRYLQSTYSRKSLHGCLVKHLPTLPPSPDDAEMRLMTFEEYNKTTVKSRPLSVREMFGKQLCQLAGITPEKALAITESYPTPARLIKAYAACSGQKERDQLLTSIKFGPTKRGVGPQMSKIIAMLYYNKDIR